MHISPHLLLSAYVLLAHSMIAGIWLIGGRWMGLSRRAAADWLRASLSNGSALLLAVNELGPSSHHALNTLLACTTGVLAAASMRRGLLSFLRLPHHSSNLWRLSAFAAAFNLLLCLPLGWMLVSLVASCLAVVGLMLLVGWETYAVIAQEFGRGAARTTSFLLGASALMFVLTIVVSAIGRTSLAEQLPSTEFLQVTTVFVTLVLSIMLAYVLGYIVVMRLVNRLRHLSQHDSLTGLLNRRAFEHMLSRELLRLQRFHDPFSVLLVDIDHFKRVNDRLGHAAGDAVLQQVAQTLVAQAREVDRVARYGGEEFCVLLPRTDHEGAMQAAERLREAVQAHHVNWRDETLAMTISVGMACAAEHSEPLDALMRRADLALYLAKSEGRNRVAAAAPNIMPTAAD